MICAPAVQISPGLGKRCRSISPATSVARYQASSNTRTVASPIAVLGFTRASGPQNLLSRSGYLQHQAPELVDRDGVGRSKKMDQHPGGVRLLRAGRDARGIGRDLLQLRQQHADPLHVGV